MDARMRGVVPRLAVVAVLALAAIGTGMAAAPRPFVPVQQSSCWECHSAWTPPLKAIMVPLPPVNVSVGASPIEYTVQMQDTWKADVTYLQPTLDISTAPSLRFAGGHGPIHNRSSPMTVPVNLATGQSETGKNDTFLVPEGASFLSFGIDPQDTNPTTAPDLILTLHPPKGPEIRVNEHGPGQKEVREFSRAELTQYGTGRWTVGAKFTPIVAPGGVPDPNNPHLPTTGNVVFYVTQDTLFDTTGLAQVTYSRQESVPRGTSTLVTWFLTTVDTPQPGEFVSIYANVTGFYEHINGPPPLGNSDNFTYLGKASVELRDGRPQIINKDTTSIRPAVLNGATLASISEAIGYASAFLLVSSILSGGMFGRASRRSLNSVFGSAKRRVAFHNFLSYGLTAAALGHTVVFLIESQYQLLIGIIWGGIAILSMFALGVTGAMQVPMIRKWNYGTWRWTHYGLTVAALLFTVLHMFLDGTNFGDLRGKVGIGSPIFGD